MPPVIEEMIQPIISAVMPMVLMQGF